MKKTLKIVLVAVLLVAVAFSLSACGKKEESENKANGNGTQSSQDNNTQVSTDESFSRGEWNGNQYVNNFAKIKFSLPTGWGKASDEEIAKIMEIGVEQLNQDQKELAELAKQTTVYGMVVNNPTTGENVSVLLEKPAVKITTDTYLETLKSQLQLVSSIKYEIGEASTTKIGNENYSVLSAKATVSDVTVGQNYYVKAEGDYIITIIVTTTADEQLNTILASFK